MSTRHLPVHPDLAQLRRQAKELLREYRNGESAAVAEFQQFAPHSIDPAAARLADAQFALARAYGVSSWRRLVLACGLIDAIRADDIDTLRALITRHPNLVSENARATEKCNWGPPMSYAANLGRDRVIALLRDHGADDLDSAISRAVLQGRIETARKLTAMGARLGPNAILGPAETVNAEGMAHVLEFHSDIPGARAYRLEAAGMVLETYCRKPEGKHRCLDLLESAGINLPDTPTMAVHRGRIDLLARHLHADPQLLTRTFTLREIYPLEVGCHDDNYSALHATPLAGTTLLHLCMDYGEMEIARWLIDRGMDVNVRADVDPDGFGGHTPLFGALVSEVHVNRLPLDFTGFLLDNGANPNARATLRRRIMFVEDDTLYEYHDVTPLGYAERFSYKPMVGKEAIKLLIARGGTL